MIRRANKVVRCERRGWTASGRESKGSTQADLHTSIPGQLLNTNTICKSSTGRLFCHGQHRDRSDNTTETRSLHIMLDAHLARCLSSSDKINKQIAGWRTRNTTGAWGRGQPPAYLASAGEQCLSWIANGHWWKHA